MNFLPLPLQKQVKESEYGTDVHTVRAEYERHQKEHKVIDQFQGNVEKCREAEVRFHGEELKIYGERMTILQKVGCDQAQKMGGSVICAYCTFLHTKCPPPYHSYTTKDVTQEMAAFLRNTLSSNPAFRVSDNNWRE